MKTKLISTILFLAIISFACNKLSEIKSIEVSGVEVPEILLNGTWKFTMNPPEKFWENTIDFQSWEDIQVPGECQMQGFAIKHDKPYVYKTEFNVPKDYDGKEIQLNFHGVYSYARVWVNGNYVRDHHGGFTKWTCDISDFVEAGEKAILSVEITDRTDEISYASGYAKHQIGGILRNVELTALPLQNFKKLYFETDLDEDYKNADLNVFYELSKNTRAEIIFELRDVENKVISSTKKHAELTLGQLSIPVENPEKWDAEHPNLYTLVTTLFEDGKQILKTSEKIGFREVEIDGNRMLVNGKPVKLRGACRHDVHPTLGRMSTPEYDLKDVLLSKECNMNFIRTSHYPPSQQFLEYCDKYGLYVEDETAICFVHSHRSANYKATGSSADSPEFTDRYLGQLKEMVHNHRNHASIIIWSVGNENVFGKNFKLSYDWVKENDTTRPVMFSYPQNVPEGVQAYDIFSNHYPNWDGTSTRYKGATIENFEYGNIPALFDEWAHVACYNKFELKEDPNVRNFWGQSLDSMWTTLFEADGGLGGAIWCMLDETFMLPENLDGFNQWWGIIDTNISHQSYMGQTVGYGEWGIVDTWRRKKPEFWTTKKAYSPTKIYSKQINDFKAGETLKIPVHNRFDHTNFSELKIMWKYGDKRGELTNVNLKPHQKGELIFPANNWNSEEKLNIQFLQNDSLLLDEYNIQLGKRTVELPICKKGNLLVKETKTQITITGKAYSVEVNKNTGLLKNLIVNDELLVKSGPRVNLLIPGEAKQTSISMDDYAKNWKLNTFKFSADNGVASLKIIGAYEKVSVSFDIYFDENGLFDISYELFDFPSDKIIQQAGLKFIVGNLFEKLTWDKHSYFTAYPANHLGSPSGQASLSEKPNMTYRKKPEHAWELDTKSFYYFGLKPELPYTNIIRGLKENIYSYSLNTANSKIEVLSNGTHACRFDRIDEENILIVNELWDYSSLGWGNYWKQIKSEGKLKGSIKLMLK